MKIKILSIIFLITIFFYSARSLVSASEEFSIDSTITYEVKESGGIFVSQNINMENLTTDLYATSYSVELTNIQPQNIRAFEGKNDLKSEVSKNGEETIITTYFNDSLVGKGKSRNFDITFDEYSFAQRTGEIWEISIPRLGNDSNFKNLTVKLKVPVSLGEEAYLSPEPNSYLIQNDFRIYTYNSKASQSLGITAGFGQFQVFSFTLNYHLENPLNKKSEAVIAIPPDTAFQKLYYQSIFPQPLNVTVDSDGNWLAIYNLSARQRLDIFVKGSVQIFAGPRPFLIYPDVVLANNLKETDFWQVNDIDIKTIADRLKTPFDIYNFVSKNLSYDISRVKPNYERLGAQKALANPSSAICMEYTDAFIAIARAAGIPAREINGYAYTENRDIQPLSLVSDVLHAWPEYWDGKKNLWIPIDPTWASTTGGVDYFNKLDLRHFTFVIHGNSPSYPYPPGSYKLGPNPQKDVFVNFGQLPEKKISKPNIYAEVKKTFGIFNKEIDIVIDNPGPSAIYNSKLNIYFDSVLKKNTEVDILTPYSKYEEAIKIPFGILGTKAPEEVKIEYFGEKISLHTNKKQIMLTNLVVLFMVLILIVLLIIFRLKRYNPFHHLFKFIKALINNTHEKIKQITDKKGL